MFGRPRTGADRQKLSSTAPGGPPKLDLGKLLVAFDGFTESFLPYTDTALLGHSSPQSSWTGVVFSRPTRCRQAQSLEGREARVVLLDYCKWRF
jgi:hypothetical protein